MLIGWEVGRFERRVGERLTVLRRVDDSDLQHLWWAQRGQSSLQQLLQSVKLTSDRFFCTVKPSRLSKRESFSWLAQTKVSRHKIQSYQLLEGLCEFADEFRHYATTGIDEELVFWFEACMTWAVRVWMLWVATAARWWCEVESEVDEEVKSDAKRLTFNSGWQSSTSSACVSRARSVSHITDNREGRKRLRLRKENENKKENDDRLRNWTRETER